MDDDIVARMEAEEVDLAQKLDAVRQFLAVYRGRGHGSPAKPSRAEAAAPRSARSLEDRMDKFGPYGQRIVETVAKLLPANGGNPVPTRTLVKQLQALDVEITGDNKVNSLSALLARSSKMKGYGRAGWTLQSSTPGEMYPLILDEAVRKENEPHSGEAGGSDAGQREAGTFPKPWETNPSHSAGSTS